MVTHYIANEYPSEDVRSKVNPPKLGTIADFIEVGNGGWENIGQEPLTKLGAKIQGVNISLFSKYDADTTIRELTAPYLQKHLPCIVWMDRLMLKDQIRGEGPLHAMVVSGMGNERMTLHDPLKRSTDTFGIDKIDDAWDPEMNTALQVELSSTLSPVYREEA
jgi:hypothetical protein